LIIGHAPGKIVHHSRVPWEDRSGDRLRTWLDIDKETFYDSQSIAIMPMGFCYPGTGKSGDLPPRKECAPLWHQKLLHMMPGVELTLLFGQYAQKYYLGKERKQNLTETVKAYRQYLPKYLPLPHPSPRNNIWQKKNPWFMDEVIPVLQKQAKKILS
jgi:uracil-DNA glycosylase